MDCYNRGAHSKFSLKVHIILVTKYRKNIFTIETCDISIKQFLREAAENHGCKIVQMETDKDHVHILLEYSPQLCISDIVKQLKQGSTYKMWTIFKQDIEKYYWKKKLLWSDGYFACSIGQISQAIVEQYIQNQG